MTPLVAAPFPRRLIRSEQQGQVPDALVCCYISQDEDGVIHPNALLTLRSLGDEESR